MSEAPLTIVEYHPAWAELFAAEQAMLAGAFGTTALAIEHVGSTAVPGLPSKPILDIAVELNGVENLPVVIPSVEGLGYMYRGDGLHVGRHFFRKPPESGAFEDRTHNLHVYEPGHVEFFEVVAFRDYLRSHPDIAADYGALKQDLAAKGLRGRDYTVAKAPFIQRCLRDLQHSKGDRILEPVEPVAQDKPLR